MDAAWWAATIWNFDLALRLLVDQSERIASPEKLGFPSELSGALHWGILQD